MKKLLVIFHVYYSGQVGYFLDRLGSIVDCEWDLTVTYSVLDEAVREKITAFKPDARFVKATNYGYDIWPFISAVKQTDISGYKYVMKIHTKNCNEEVNRINGMRLKGYMWRDLLVDSMLKDKQQFLRTMSILDSDPKVGMVCSGELLKKPSKGLAEDLSALDRELERIGMETKDRRFCAGTMFVARSAVFDVLRTDLVSEEIFVGLAKSHSAGTRSHVYERVLGCLVSANGYTIRGLSSNRKAAFTADMNRMFSPILQNIFAIQREGEDRAKYLTVFGMKFRLHE